MERFGFREEVFFEGFFLFSRSFIISGVGCVFCSFFSGIFVLFRGFVR